MPASDAQPLAHATTTKLRARRRRLTITSITRTPRRALDSRRGETRTAGRGGATRTSRMALIGIVGAAAAFFMFGGLGGLDKSAPERPARCDSEVVLHRRDPRLRGASSLADLRRRVRQGRRPGERRSDAARARRDRARRRLRLRPDVARAAARALDARGGRPWRVRRRRARRGHARRAREVHARARREARRARRDARRRELRRARGHGAGGGQLERAPAPRLRTRRPARRRQGHVVRRDARRRRPDEARAPRRRPSTSRCARR